MPCRAAMCRRGGRGGVEALCRGMRRTCVNARLRPWTYQLSLAFDSRAISCDTMKDTLHQVFTCNERKILPFHVCERLHAARVG